MVTHSFILKPDAWLGEGKIQLNMVDEELSFFTRWNISPKSPEGKIECLQEIQVKGLSDIMMNQFLLSNLGHSETGEFAIELENQALGKVTGKGLINDKVIAWEFRVPEIGFEGFEFYEKIDEETYLMRAEYSTADEFRTLIQGKIWKQKVNPSKEAT